MDTRLAALRRFAIAITVLNLFGHTLLGFEQSPAQPVFSLLTAYSIEVLLEYVQSKADGRRARFLHGGFQDFVDFMLPSHITGLAVAMLLYANDRLIPVIFAAGVAVCSKAIFNVNSGNGRRHFFNPSNFGISITLLLFPSVGITPPYMFTEGLGTIGSIVLPVLIITSGTFLNFRFTHKIPLLASWVSGFICQAVIRHYLFGTQLLPIMGVMTGMTFVLYTFYMITDPGTTPVGTRSQIAFGLSVGLLYGVLVVSHVVFGMFFALTIVCLCRGMFLAIAPATLLNRRGIRNEQPVLAGVK
jgi:hypothetical protein